MPLVEFEQGLARCKNVFMSIKYFIFLYRHRSFAGNKFNKIHLVT